MSYDGQKTPLTNFDKLAVQICLFGAAIILVLHFVFVETASSSYRALENMPSVSKIVYTPAFAIASAMLMGFLAYYGTRMRRMYDNSTASNVLFMGIVVAIGCNGLLMYGLFAPTAGALDGIY